MKGIHLLFWFKYLGRPIQVSQKGRIFCPYWVYTNTFICKYPYSKAPAGQRVEFGTTKGTSILINRNLAAEIAPHIYSALRDLGVFFEKYILYSSTKLVDEDLQVI